MKKVILVIASKGYQPQEYGVTKDTLEKAGFEVITASDDVGIAYASAGDIEATVDILIDDIIINGYDGLFFVGGPKALEHLDNEISHSLLRNWEKSGRPYGAICISPRILASAGVLKNKKATGWNGDGKLTEIFENNQVEYIQESVVTDGNVVTADGPDAVEEFGQAVVKVLN